MDRSQVNGIGSSNWEISAYCVHLNDIISTTTNSKEKTTLEGKFNKLIDPKVLLQ